jgi:lipoprotein NlpI
MRFDSIVITAVALQAGLIPRLQSAEESVEMLRLRAAALEAEGQFGPALAALDRWIALQPDAAEAFQMRGVVHFKAGRAVESVRDFDRLLALRPDREPDHWQRGISQYYAGQYEQGVRQFELHKRVNPQDVENAVWHYLCKARIRGVEQARAALIDIGGDRRPWAMTVYRMFQGRVTPAEVLQHANEVSGTEAERRDNLFYAHLYVGLFHEAAGRADESLKHIEIAVEKYPSPDYMGDVARVHRLLRKNPPAP